VANPSFDVVSEVDHQEVDNALKQTAKELGQRYDFRGTETQIEWSGKNDVVITSSAEPRALAALDVFKEKLVRRGVSLKALDAQDPRQSGKTYRIQCAIVEGINADQAKKIAAKIRGDGPKGVQAQIQGDQLRVSAKKKDDLQAVIALLKNADFGVALQFTNYR
jgi:cyclic-di-GMP-binding protein